MYADSFVSLSRPPWQLSRSTLPNLRPIATPSLLTKRGESLSIHYVIIRAQRVLISIKTHTDSHTTIPPSLLANSYFDEAVVDKTRTEQYKSLSALAATTSPSLTHDKVLSLLQIAPVSTAAEATNHGNKITNELKYHIKLGRQTGIHVSPTVLWDGIVENSISSGWTLEQWKEFFGSKL